MDEAGRRHALHRGEKARNLMAGVYDEGSGQQRRS